MRLAYVATYDSTDIRSWSGIPFHLAQALDRQGLQLVHANPLTDEYSRSQRVKGRIYRHLLRRPYMPHLERNVLDGYARQVCAHLAGRGVDAIFALGSHTIAHLECDAPVVFYDDATFNTLANSYGEFSGLSQETLRRGHAMERAALSRCALALYSSRHAAASAIRDYGADPRKVRVIPFGANLESGRARDEVRADLDARPRDRCRLLFLGKDWQRKGGEIALEVARWLNSASLPTEITFVGGEPLPKGPLPSFAHYAGYLDKGAAADVARLSGLLRESHFLILPSRAESFGIVFCEANSFGVPALASDVDGIPSAITNGLNGQMFPRAATPEDYGRFVRELFADYERYRALALASFDEYTRRLNWAATARTIHQCLSELVAGADAEVASPDQPRGVPADLLPHA